MAIQGKLSIDLFSSIPYENLEMKYRFRLPFRPLDCRVILTFDSDLSGERDFVVTVSTDALPRDIHEQQVATGLTWSDAVGALYVYSQPCQANIPTLQRVFNTPSGSSWVDVEVLPWLNSKNAVVIAPPLLGVRAPWSGANFVTIQGELLDD